HFPRSPSVKGFATGRCRSGLTRPHHAKVGFPMSDDMTPDQIVRHYNEADEASRLRQGWFQLEQARTQELILRHLPPAPATVIDAGGGAGAYACWLASRGY